jgi:hypothetical protein
VKYTLERRENEPSDGEKRAAVNARVFLEENRPKTRQKILETSAVADEAR